MDGRTDECELADGLANISNRSNESCMTNTFHQSFNQHIQCQHGDNWSDAKLGSLLPCRQRCKATSCNVGSKRGRLVIILVVIVKITAQKLYQSYKCLQTSPVMHSTTQLSHSNSVHRKGAFVDLHASTT